MSVYQDSMEKLRSLTDLREERFNKPRRTGGALSPKSQVEHEKRMRREIANSNERRRMQSINTGFESLKTLLPTHDGEKLSKAAILQLTTKFITNLVSENRRLSSQLTNMRQLALNATANNATSIHAADPNHHQAIPSPPSRKRKADNDILEDHYQVPTVEELIRENSDLKTTLDQERSQREQIEDQIKSLRDSKLRNTLCQQLQLSETPLLVKKEKPGYEEFALERVVPDTESVQQPTNPSTTRGSEDTLANSGSLDHLVMAIEQIEGKFSCAGRQQVAQRQVSASASAASTAVAPSSTTIESVAHSDRVSSPATPVVQPMISPFTSATVSIPLGSRNRIGASETTTIRSVSLSESETTAAVTSQIDLGHCNTSGGDLVVSSVLPVSASDDKKTQLEYPIVSKLLNRPIPHKYLHRSHVVVNSSH